MNKSNTFMLDPLDRPSPEGIFTRWGSPVTEILGFGSETLDGIDEWHRTEDGRLAGQWWVTLTLDDGKVREYPMDRLVADSDDAVGRENMNALSRACMAYLAANGEFSPCGKWVKTK